MRTSSTDLDLVLTVSERREAADGVVVLELSSPEGDPLPSWTPGSHVEIETPDGLLRQYSLCGDPKDAGTWQLGVLLEPASRGGSRYVHEQLHPRSRVKVTGLRNHFELVPAERYLFIAGGIGITPILPMLTHAERSGIDWTLVYGGRTRSSMAFADELATSQDARVNIVPQDEEGLIDLPSVLATPHTGTAVYCCGPEPLLDAVTETARHWAPEAIHMERFAPRTIESTDPVQAFEVECAESRITLQVPPDQSILDVATEAGIDVPSSCGEGTCGTCETVVLEGEVDHRDSLMTPAEQQANATMMICVSRAACPRLVLEI